MDVLGRKILAVARWWEYVEEVTGGAAQKDIAHRAGIDKSHVSLWKVDEKIPAAPFVVKFARAYGRNPLEALVAAEYITVDEADLHEVRTGIGEFTTEQLLEEALHRIRLARG